MCLNPTEQSVRFSSLLGLVLVLSLSLSTLQSLSFVFMVLQLVPIPGLSGVHFGKESYIMLAVWIAIGLAFYAVQWKHFRKDD